MVAINNIVRRSSSDRVLARSADQALVAIRAERLARRIEKVLGRDSDKSAKAVIKDEAGNVLLIKYSTYGTWDLPGGHLHEGESLDQGLRREVREETGLEILGESWRSSGNNGRSEVFDAAVAGVKPRVRLSTEHIAYKWVEAEKAEELVPFWLQGPSANAGGSSRASFYPGNGQSPTPGNQNALKQKLGVRDEAEIEVAKAVSRVITLAEAEVLAKKQDDDAFWTYAAATFFGAIMAAYGQTAQKLAVIERGADHGEAVTEAEERAHAAQRAELLKDFPRRVKDQLAAEVKRGQELGETEAELHRRVGVEGDKILQGEGRVVAETEAQAIAGTATLRALKRAGYVTAFWVTVGDERVRESHTACEAAGAVKLGDKFPNGCRFPGDPLAPLAETINCRCVLEGASRRETVEASTPIGHEFRGNQFTSGNGVIKDKHGVDYNVRHFVDKDQSGKDRHHYEVTKDSKHVAKVDMSVKGDKAMYVGVAQEHRRRGIASALYKHIESHIGKPLVENWATTENGAAFWKSRVSASEQGQANNPEGHNQWSKLFHGTNAAPFGKFSKQKFGSATDHGFLGAGVYLSTDFQVGRSSKRVAEASVEFKNPLNLKMEKWNQDKNKIVRTAVGLPDNATGEELNAELKRRKHDGVVLDYSPLGYHHSEIAALDADQVKIHKWHEKS